MLNQLARRQRVLLGLAGLLTLLLLVLGLFSTHFFKNALANQFERYVLADPVRTISREMNHALVDHMQQARQAVSNPYFLDWLQAGSPAAGLPAFRKYANSIKESTGATTVSLVLEKQRTLYNAESTIPLQPDNDHWVDDFLASGKHEQVVMNTNPDLFSAMLYIDVRIDLAQQGQAVVSLGFDAKALTDRLRALTVGDSGLIFLIDERGLVQVHPMLNQLTATLGIRLGDLPGQKDIEAKLLRKNDLNLVHYTGPNGPMVVVSSYLPDARLFLVLEMSEAEASGSLNRAIMLVGLVNVLVVIVLLLTLFRGDDGPAGGGTNREKVMLRRGEGATGGTLSVKDQALDQAFDSLILQLVRMFQRTRDQAQFIYQNMPERPVRDGQNLSALDNALGGFVINMQTVFMRLGAQAALLGEAMELFSSLKVRLVHAVPEDQVDDCVGQLERLSAYISVVATGDAVLAAHLSDYSALASDQNLVARKTWYEACKVADTLNEVTSTVLSVQNRSAQMAKMAVLLRDLAAHTQQSSAGYAIAPEGSVRLAACADEAGDEIEQISAMLTRNSLRTLDALAEFKHSLQGCMKLLLEGMAHIRQVQTAGQAWLGPDEDDRLKSIRLLLQQLDQLLDDMAG